MHNCRMDINSYTDPEGPFNNCPLTMDDLKLADHLPRIEAMVARYLVARVELVASKEDIGGKLGQSNWSSIPGVVPLIQFPRRISGAEVADSLLALALRGIVTKNPTLVQHADEITTSSEYLEHLVLHEVAHIKNNWTNDRETECDLWVYEQLHAQT